MIKAKQWFQFKELAAGKNRLLLSYYIYKIFGSAPLRIIAFFVVLFTFIGAKEQKLASKKYFSILEEYTGKCYKPYCINSFKQFFNYGNSLVDKIISFSGNINPKIFHFENETDRNEIDKLMGDKKGIFFIPAHIGNIEILRSLLQSGELKIPKTVNIFMDKNYCKIFNEFLKDIQIDSNTQTYSTEDISLDTGITLSEKLANGEIVFMAGDRIAKTNPEKTYDISFLNRTIQAPLGTAKLALMLKSPIYFIVCAKTPKGFEICTQKFEHENLTKNEALKKFKTEYGKFLQNCTLKYPHQFFNFFDVFSDN